MRALRSREATLVLAVGLVALAGLADYVTGDDTAFTLVYLAPVALAAWRSGRGAGLFVAALSATSWLVVEHQRTVSLSAVVQAWNMATELGVFVTVSSLLVRLKQRLELEAQRGLTDPLTGLKNRRGFTAAATVEFDRARRHGHPLTIAFIDLDDFKLVNDRMGHEAGDGVLVDVAKVFRRRLRGVDVAARLGGDEFALLLPETDADQATALLQSLFGHVLHHFDSTGARGQGAHATQELRLTPA